MKRVALNILCFQSAIGLHPSGEDGQIREINAAAGAHCEKMPWKNIALFVGFRYIVIRQTTVADGLQAFENELGTKECWG